MDEFICVERRWLQFDTAFHFLLYHRCTWLQTLGVLLQGDRDEFDPHLYVGPLYRLGVQHECVLRLARPAFQQSVECCYYGRLFCACKMVLFVFYVQEEGVS